MRLSNIYGPGPSSGSHDRGIMNVMIKRAINGQPITIYGDGKYIRDYIYIEDVSRAFISAYLKIDRINGNYYMIGSGNGITIADAFKFIAIRVEYKTGRKVIIEYLSQSISLLPIEERNYVSNIQKFNKHTGWKPIYSLVEGIDLTIESILREKCELL